MKLSLALASLVASALASIGHGMELCGQSYSGGNMYEVFTAGSFTWEEARDYAAMKTYCGVQGHLVTITSSAENAVVTSAVNQCGTARVSWIGLSDHEYEGTFQWVTGEPFSYSSWCSGEPNGNSDGEDYIEIMIADGCWNDIILSGYGNVDKFVVEYENVPKDCDSGAYGDPHFKTWTGEWFDFQGECDLHLVDAPSFAPDLDLVIDIRTKIRYDYSYIESAVLKIGDDTLEVASFGEFFINGVEGGDLPAAISGFPLEYTQPSNSKHQFVIQLAGDEKIVISSMKDMVSVKIQDPDATHFQNSKGMMGEFGTGNLLARDGKTIIEDPNAFAAEWQVHDNEPMLFQSAHEPQYPQKCVLPGAIKQKTRRLGETLARSAAEMACAKWNGHAFEACVYDVMATGDLEMADAGAF